MIRRLEDARSFQPRQPGEAFRPKIVAVVVANAWCHTGGIMDEIDERTLRVLADVTETRGSPLPMDTDLYDRGLLDSMTTVQLIAALSEEFGVDISPAEFDRGAWATPGGIAADMHRRLQP